MPRNKLILHFWVFTFLIFLDNSYANSSGQVDWKIYSTPHFKIVFHDDVKPQADIAQEFLEIAYEKIATDMGYYDKNIPITVVLTGLPDNSNGLSTPVGHRIIIYTRPAQVIGSPEISWLKRVLAHELAHQITFLTLRKSFLGIYSEVYKTSKLPAWFVEGLAQYESESWDAKRNTFFAHALYNSALDPYPNLAVYTKEDPVSGRLVYEQGHAFLRFLAQRQKKDFIKKLLRRIRVIPVWSEFTALLSPLTSSWLPLESAIKSLTYSSTTMLYSEFLATMRVGQKGIGKIQNPKPIIDLKDFSVIYQAKSMVPNQTIFTGQKAWDEPTVSLFALIEGKVEKLNSGMVNPVFDLSPNGQQILFVSMYQNRYGDPVEKLFLMDLKTRSSLHLSDGAAHPIFIGSDSIAYSFYRHGKQALVLCALKNTFSSHEKPVCSELANDSLVNFYALSRSTHGMLFNATDTAGKTNIFEYSQPQGFIKILPDSANAEFAVEVNDSIIWVQKERQGLTQIDAYNRLTGLFTPISNYPLGTYYLHRSSHDTLATLLQTGPPGNWKLNPVAVVPVVQDSHALNTAHFIAPEYLKTPSPTFTAKSPMDAPAPAKDYLSILEIRPLLLLPTGFPEVVGGGLGPQILLEDPLQQHSLSLSAAPINNGFGYDLAYTNRQYPIDFVFQASNSSLRVSDLKMQTNWRNLYLANRITDFSLLLKIPAPWDIPMPHWLYLGIKGISRTENYTLWGAQENGIPKEEIPVKKLNGWSFERPSLISKIYLTYGYALPYKYGAVHPLMRTELSLGYSDYITSNSRSINVFARQTIPIVNEFTYTIYCQGEWVDFENRSTTYLLPDGQASSFYNRYAKGFSNDVYNSVDFPLVKGFITELPLFGLWNYLGGSFFTGMGLDEYRDAPGQGGSGLSSKRLVAGGKILGLFHPLRMIPLVLSQSAQYDFSTHQPVYKLQIEYDGLPSDYSILANTPRGRF